MAENGELRKTAEETHKMSPGDAKAAVEENPKRQPAGEIRHGRMNFPAVIATIAVAGLLISGGVGYLVLSAKKKAQAAAFDAAKAAVKAAADYYKETHPRK